MWCSALGCYVGAGEARRGHSDPGGDGEAEGSGSGSGSMRVGAGVVGGQEDGDVEVEDGAEAGEMEDRTTKRRRVGVTDG